MSRVRRLWSNRYFKIGFLLLVLGTGPLLAVIAAAKLGFGDPNPNPIGCGILAFLTFWPSIILIVLGIVMTARDSRRQ
ncbi:MAG TPA: hypothetical protein VIA29_11550 [Thermoanaerobaculia bacterium]|jgi:hypothetical protein